MNNTKGIVFWFGLLALLLLSPTQPHANEDELTPRQQEIIQTVFSGGGFITEALHKEFWASLPRQLHENEAIKNDYIKNIDRVVASGTRFQRETWASMKASLEAHRVVKTIGLDQAKQNVMNVSQNPVYVREARKNISKVAVMLTAAANGTPYQTSQGPMYITPELVNQVLAGLDGSIARFQRLLQPKWKQEIKEYRYEDAHVAILSDVPFSIVEQNLTVENGKKVKLTMLTNQLNETDYVAISFNEFDGVLEEPDSVVIRMVNGTIKGAGASPMLVSSSKWRGERSATGTGQSVTSVGVFYISTRVVEMPKQQGALSFIAVSATSKIEADALRDSLELSTQLLR